LGPFLESSVASIILQASSSAAGVKFTGLRVVRPKISRFDWKSGVDNLGVAESSTGLGKTFGPAVASVGTRLEPAGDSWANAGRLPTRPMAADMTNTAIADRNNLVTVICILISF
jgi:hypothetical protein